MKIGVISDTHGWVDPAVQKYFTDADEIWHAGDVGSSAVLDELSSLHPLRAVWGNCDGNEVRLQTKEFLDFTAGGKRVLMMHIGGYPGHYSPRAVELISLCKPDIFVCGHSHILKVIWDTRYKMLCVNPGSAGRSGMHRVRTLIRFEITDSVICNMEVIETGRRGGEESF